MRSQSYERFNRCGLFEHKTGKILTLRKFNNLDFLRALFINLDIGV